MYPSLSYISPLISPVREENNATKLTQLYGINKSIFQEWIVEKSIFVEIQKNLATDSQIKMRYSEDIYPLQKESYQIIGICMEVHRILGKGLLEIVYKDALEYEFKNNKIPYEREKKYEVEYKGFALPHYFFADFVVFDKIILEIKAQKGIVDEHYSWVINYLAISKNPLGLIVNFGEKSLVTKRIIN